MKSNCLAETFPDLVLQWSEKNLPVTPKDVSWGSHRVVWWKGECGHEWQASVKSRTVNQTGCPFCSHNKVLVGFNDLASQRPEVAAEWSERNGELLPTMVTPFSNRKVWWKCTRGHQWSALISTRSNGSKCPYCSGIKLLPGFNDLVSTKPRLAAEWSERNLPLRPDRVNEKSRRNVWWKCKVCGYEWKCVIQTRANGSDCPVCAGRTVMKGYNDLATTDPQLLEEWDYDKNGGISPTEISRNSMRPVWWKCSMGHPWRAQVADRTLKGSGCRVCEAEYRSVFPQLMVGYYAAKKGLKVRLNDASILGIPLETYIPEERLAIESKKQSKDIELLKEHLCQKRGILRVMLPYPADMPETGYAEAVKKAFQKRSIFLPSNTQEDTEIQRIFAHSYISKL